MERSNHIAVEAVKRAADRADVAALDEAKMSRAVRDILRQRRTVADEFIAADQETVEVWRGRS